MLGFTRRPRPTPPPPPIPDPPLDELALRRPDFVDGPRNTRIELANGQSWAFPLPVIMIRMEPGPDGVLGFGKAMWGDGGTRFFGQEYLDMLDRCTDVARNDVAYLNAMAGTVALLLRQNYNLADGHLAALLPWVIGDDRQNEEMWTAIQGVVTGRGKKPGPDGDGSASSLFSPEAIAAGDDPMEDIPETPAEDASPGPSS